MIQTQYRLSAFLRSGFRFRFQESSNLVNWSVLGGPVDGSNARFFVTNSFSGRQRFFRLAGGPQP